ncbi:MAG: UDP-N-acetylglucosamine pyrophosphorylase [Papillibacter sp.]|nr:UDP-N-acetylglucosamine pyrophosphorylase [Papillibacter sp.]
MITLSELYDLSKTIAAELFKGKRYPWEILDELSGFILALGPTLPKEDFDNPSEGVWIAKSAKVYPSACINAPCIIDREAEVRHCAFIRGSAIVGKNAVVGNSTELKNALLFDGVQVPHYNYVGDSVLGYKAHMGAGSITCNIKSDKTPVIIRDGNDVIATGRKKIGAFLGDFVEVGCNSTLNPGTVIGRNSTVYPLSLVRGIIPEKCIYKNKTAVEIVPKK